MIGKLALLLCVAVASGNPAAGKPWNWLSKKPLVDERGKIAHPRIVGGVEVVPHSYPHMVALFIDSLYFCSGSLISDEWVMTAAHCMDGAGFVDVVMGAHNIGQNEPTQVTMTSTDFFTHENWNSFTLANDIALIRLPSAVGLTDEISPVGLGTFVPPAGTIVTLTGWGHPSDSSGSISDVLLEVDVPIMDNESCDAIYGIILDSMICTDSSGGMGTCNGDSGGPMNYDGVVIGITSFGASAGCEAGYPNAFTSVISFLDWIAANTGITP